MNNDCIGNSQPKKIKTCKRNAHQFADISLPVKLKPVTIVGEISTECIGEPSIICDYSNNLCEIVITQTICITIPIEYGVKPNVGKSNIKCKDKGCQ